ncbi:MAG: S41 family peptidase [Desulfobacterales bacterium]
MITGKNRRVSLWGLLITAVVFWTIGTGFSRDLSASDDETYKGLKLFADIIDLIETTYVDPVDTKALIKSAIDGMVHSLDPHSAFLVARDYEELQIDTQGEFTGIGIQITMRDGLVTVISPIEGTPAHKAGIKAGDKIIKVNGEKVKDLPDAVKQMRGPRGTAVTVTILRKGESEPLEFELKRDMIPIRSVRYSLLKPGYGFVRVTNFSVNTEDDLLDALEALESGDVALEGLILDLRNNPGGLLDQAVSISDFFLEEGDIVSIKGRQKRNTRVFSAHKNPADRRYPVVVLINGGSASASEIVAGALQDNKRALILGTTSFGKGSVQTVESLRDGNGLKLTIARYYTPNGRSIQAQGIEPDIIVKQQSRKRAEKPERRRHIFKEKDLENHLDAEPRKNKDSSEAEKDKKENETPQPVESWSGPLTKERLLADNLISRALEILVSYGILKPIPS